MNGVWVYLASQPLFGLTATLAAYLLCAHVSARLGHPAWANPVLGAVLLLIGLLLATGLPYEHYFAGAQFVHVMLGPAVVALAWPLWQRRRLLRRHAARLLTAALVGGGVTLGSTAALAWGLGLPQDLLPALLPKSVTAPVAMGIAEQLGGAPALAATLAVCTGLMGAILGPSLLTWGSVPAGADTWAARGFALGTVAHGIGTARALQEHPDAGALAGLALGLQAVLQALLLPPLLRLL